MESYAQPYFQLWTSMGGTTFPEPGDPPIADSLWPILEHSRLPHEWDTTQSEQDVPATPGLCLGYPWEREVGPSRELGDLQCQSKYAHSSGIDHHQWCTAAVVCSWLSIRRTPGLRPERRTYQQSPSKRLAASPLCGCAGF